MTSVGSGSLMIVLLLFLYPMLGANQLVGTDLTQAVPLTLAAALGALAFGHVEFSVTTSIIIGSVPAVFVGSLISSRAPDHFIRPVITFVIFASGLKYVGRVAPGHPSGSASHNWKGSRPPPDPPRPFAGASVPAMGCGNRCPGARR